MGIYSVGIYISMGIYSVGIYMYSSCGYVQQFWNACKVLLTLANTFMLQYLLLSISLCQTHQSSSCGFYGSHVIRSIVVKWLKIKIKNITHNMQSMIEVFGHILYHGTDRVGHCTCMI